jgi:glycosyltransferase involved in cell wall biosynthesis
VGRRTGALMLASRPLPDPTALFVSYSSVLGGAERILLDLMSGLAPPAAGTAAGGPAFPEPGGGEAILACPPGPLADAARARGVRAIGVRSRPLELRAGARDRLAAPLRLTALGGEVRRAVRATRPDVVVAWNMRGLLACRAGLTGMRRRPPLVFQHNDLLPGPLIGRTVRAAARRADLVVCLSRTIAADLDPRGRIRRLEVVAAGVDLDRFTPPAGGLHAVGREVLVLGAIVPWKRPELALEIFARAATELPDLRLRFAGEPIGEEGAVLVERLRRRAAEDGLDARVDIAGRVEDPIAALRRAACLLHCADREPYGLALVEALACGVPVVAPAAGGPVEIVSERAGRLYSPGDAAGAAGAIREVLDPAHQAEYRAASRARAERLFDLEDSRRRYRALLVDLAR